MEIASALPRVGVKVQAIRCIVKPSGRHPRVRRGDQIGAFRERRAASAPTARPDGVAHA